MNIGHVAIYVKDLEESARFFETYFQGRRNELYEKPVFGFTPMLPSFTFVKVHKCSLSNILAKNRALGNIEKQVGHADS